MPQDIIDFGFDEEKITTQQRRIVKLITELYDKIIKLEAVGKNLSPINITGFTQLNQAVTQQNKVLTQANKVSQDYAKQQILAAKLSEANAKATLAETRAQAALEAQANKTAAAKAKSAEVPFTVNTGNAVQGNASGTTVSDAELANTEAQLQATRELNAEKQKSSAINTQAAAATGIFTTAIEAEVAVLLEDEAALAINKTQQKLLTNEIAKTGVATAVQTSELVALKTEQFALNESIANTRGNVKNLTKEFLSEEGSILELRAQVNRLTASYEALSVAEKQSQFGINLKTQISTLQPALQKAEGELGKFQRNVGNYGNAITGAFSKGFSFLRQAAYIIPGLGIAGILNIAIEGITSLIETLVRGNDKINTFAENFKNLSEVISDSNKDAAKHIVDLKLLYTASTDVALAENDRKDAAIALQKTYPETFANFTVEQIELGEAKTGYDELTKSIIATARAKAAKSKLDEIEAQRLDIAFQKQKIINATAAEAARAKTDKAVLSGGFGGYGGASARDQSPEEQRKIIQNRRMDALRIQDQKDASLDQQEKFLIAFVGEKNITKVVEDELDKRKAKDKQSKDDTLANLKAFINAQIEALQHIVDNDTTDFYATYKNRYEAAKEISVLQKKLSDATTKDEIKNGKDRVTAAIEESNRLIDIAKKTNDNILKIELDKKRFSENLPITAPIDTTDADLEKQRAAHNKVQAEILKDIQDFYDDRQQINNQARDEEIANVNENFNAGEISQEQHQKQLLVIERKYLKQSLQDEIDAGEKRLALLVPFSEEYNKILAALAKARKELTGVSEDNGLKALADDLQNIADIAANVAEAFTTIANIGFDNQKTNLEEIGAQEEKNYEQQQANIQNSIASDEERANQLKILDSSHAARQEEIARKQREIDNKKAEFDKAAAILTIITNTAAAVVKSLPNLPLAIAVGAFGAAQLAAAIATKVPHYAGGLEDAKSDHFGLVGEGRHVEIVERPGYEDMIVSSPTHVFLPKHSRVIPLKVSANDMANRALGMGGLVVAMNNTAKDESWDIAKWQINQMKRMQKPARVSRGTRYNLNDALYIAKNVKHTA